MALASTDRAFEELYTRHREALARYCRALVRNEHDARDVLQNVAVRVLLALRRGDRPARERAWLYRIARNEAVTLFRGRRQAEQLDEGIADPAADPTDTVLTRERLAELASDVRALSPQARTILMLSSSVELDRNQIAAELGLTPGAISQSLTETQTGLRADRTAHELSCEAIRSILSHPDGRRRRTRTVRAHLRGCEGCREWARRRGKRTGIGAFLPAPIATLARWLQPILGSDPGTAALAMRTPGIGAARTIGLIASLAAGTAGLGAGGAQSHRVAPASRAVPAPTQAHVTQRRWVATAPGASYVSSRPVVELRPTATGPAVAYSAARAAAHTKRSYPAARAALAPQRFPVAPRPAAGPAPTRAEPRATPAAASENDSAGRSPTAAATPTPGAIAFGPRRGGQVRPRPSRAS